MKNENFLLSLSISTALHLLIIYFFLFGLPRFYKYKHPEEVIIFEVLSPSDITNVPTQHKAVNKIEKIQPEEAKKVLNTTPPAEPAKEEPTEKLVEKPAEKPADKLPEQPKLITEKPKDPESKESKAAEAENIKVTPKKEEPKPKEKEPEKKSSVSPTKPVEKKPDPKPKPKEVKKQEKNTEDEYLESLLKSLEKSSKGNNAKSAKTLEAQGDKQINSKGSGSESNKLSITEIDLIRRKIHESWPIPAGAQGAADVRVTLYIAFEQDGSITKVKVQNISCPSSEQNVCRAIEDSALRAVRIASPIENLRKERYEIWKEMYLEFDLNDILR